MDLSNLLDFTGLVLLSNNQQSGIFQHSVVFVRKLMIDRDFREHVSREQLKYLKANEYVVFFKQEEEIK